ncbi:MAG: hypothetical protein Q8Q28_12160, partial [Pseudomonadota bacterium]|nr:hypothetical protein [Pseudomonadota bacterium]
GLILPAIAAALESAPIWGPALLNAGRAAWGAATGFVRTNPGMVVGTIGGGSGAAGYYSTTPKPTLGGAGVATGMGVVQGVLAVYLPGAGTFAQGAVIGSFGDSLSQGINIGLGNQKSFNYVEASLAGIGGGAATKLTGMFAPTWSQQASAATIAWPVSTAATAIGQKLGETSSGSSASYNSPLFTPSASTSFNDMSRGIMLYPSKPNTNNFAPYVKP